MWKAILQKVKATFPVIAGCLISTLCNSQQWVIANKDNTRPETKRQYEAPAARVYDLAATRLNGHNEIRWNTSLEQNTRKFIVEYSYDGINFQSAGEVVAGNGIYNMNHATLDNHSVLYRLRIESLNGKTNYSNNIILDGMDQQFIKVYPTAISTGILNINSGIPVERINIISPDGKQLFSKSMSGVEGSFKFETPVLTKGFYFIQIVSNGFQQIEKIIVQ